MKKLDKLTQLSIYVLLFGAFMFMLSYLPAIEAFHDVLYYVHDVEECDNNAFGTHYTAHEHWTAQGHIYFWYLFIVWVLQVIRAILWIKKHDVFSKTYSN